ncbi:hypothetical protein [Streptomyces sp. cg35]|uniref:hypothetical protein n=1 Tax=Streptomyces sp. cg35 TaxID=3421650 RepID=UPI003D1771A9
MAEETYRVTWKHVDTGKDHVHVQEFRDIDQGYDFYQMMQRDGYCYQVRWRSDVEAT